MVLAVSPLTHAQVPQPTAPAPQPTPNVYAPLPAQVPASQVPASLPATPGQLPAPQTLPDLGDASQVALSPAQERKIGEQIVRQIRAGGGYLNDPEVNDYLNELGYRLVNSTIDTKQDFEFFAVPDPQINAFALPGGFIGIHTGLILLTQTESELASVLAHEISHVTQRHMARMVSMQKDSMLLTLAGLALAILASRAGGNAGSQGVSAAIAGTQALVAQNQLNFTREHEYEADRIGFSRLVAAGFDPNGMATFMQRLQRANRYVEGNAPSYLRTHPITYERVAEAQARALGMPYKQVSDTLDYHLVRALLKSYQGTPRETVVSFDVALRDKQYNNEIAERYGLVAALLRAKDIPRAKVELARVEKMAPPHPMIEAMAGHVLMESGDNAGAAARFQAALLRYPNKKQLIYDFPEALINDKRPAEASEFVEIQLKRFPEDGLLHQIAARAYAAQNMRLKQHEHQGEFYAWSGNLPLAVDQFELAVKAGDGDFYQISAIESRLRKLRSDMAELKKNGFGRDG